MQAGLIVAACLLLAGSTNAQMTDTQFNDKVNGVLTQFSTTVNQILSTVTMVPDSTIQNTVNTIANNPILSTVFNLLGAKAANAKAPPLSFANCDPQYFKSASKPQNARTVRFGDLGIIGSMGDSVTAGLGTIPDTITQAFLEGRGYCSKGGGTGTVAAGNTTMANIIRDLFNNTNLKGFAVADGQCSLTNVACSHLNVAVLLGFHPTFVVQAIELARRIIFSAEYDETDWKLINILYGPNDLCFLCDPTHFQKTIMAGLDLKIALSILKALLPNSIIVLHVPYDLTSLSKLSTNAVCSVVQLALCPCAKVLGPIVSKPNQMAIADILNGLAADPDLNSDPNFAITVAKHLTNTEPPKDSNGNYQTQVLSANCVHPSRAAHYIHARYVINELLTPSASRPLTGDYTVNGNTPIAIKCPTADNSYINI